MNERILEIVVSPCCKSELVTKSVFISAKSDSDKAVKIIQGILSCSACQREFPIIDSIPRLCLNLFEDEKIFLRGSHVNETDDRCDNEMPNEEESKYQIEQIVRRKILIPKNAGAYLKKRIENEIKFRVSECEKQDKYLKTLSAYYKGQCNRILEVGGGQGGLAKCLTNSLCPNLYVMVDLDLDWARVASLRNPNVEIIRGDATKLPIRDDMFDVVISQAMLEHIPDHTAALHEMCRTTRAVLFVAWGPNKNSLYDFGHLDAPVTLFSRKNAKKVAILWHKMLKTDRTHEWISSELDGTFYISTGFVKRLLKTYGTVFNVFTEFCMNSLRSEYSYRGGRIKNLLAKMPMLSKGIFKLLEFLMIEPQCYYILIKLNEHNEPRS